MGLLTMVKCYGFLWAANPCRLVYAHWDRKLPREVVRTVLFVLLDHFFVFPPLGLWEGARL